MHPTPDHDVTRVDYESTFLCNLNLAYHPVQDYVRLRYYVTRVDCESTCLCNLNLAYHPVRDCILLRHYVWRHVYNKSKLF